MVGYGGRLIALACFVGLGLGLAGCGQKGPLYLTTSSAQPATAPQTTAEPEETTTPSR